MGAIATLAQRRYAPQARNPADDFWYYPVGAKTQSGVAVSAVTALRIATVFACVKVLAEDIAGVPLILYRRLANDGKERAFDHPLYSLLHDEPNAWQTSFEWREMSMVHLLLRGNALSEILPGARGFADQLVPLHPDRMKVEQLPNRRLRYTVTQDDLSTRTLLDDQVLHMRGLSSDGIRGMSVIDVGLESMGLAMSAEAYAARFFSQDASPPIALQHPAKLSPEAAKRIGQSWSAGGAGPANWHRPRVLEEGMTIAHIGVTPEQALLIEARKHQDIDVTRWFRMQPHKVGILDRATFSNIEHQGLEHVTDTVRPWAVRLEQTFSRDLLLEPGEYFWEFLLDALARGDIKTRYEAYASAILNGWQARNEVRIRENMNPIEGLDEFLEPRNMAPAGSQPAPNGAAVGGYDDERVRAQARHLARETGLRIVRREIGAVKRLAERHAANSAAWQAEVGAFYDDHVPFVAEALNVTPALAARYADRQRRELRERGVAVLEEWEATRPDELVSLALGELSVWR